MKRKQALTIFFSSLLLIGLAGLLLRQPLDGVDREVSFSYQNSELTLELKDQYLLEDGNAGTYDVMTDEVIIATQGRSIWNFMALCSHELEHAQEFSKRHSEFQDFSRPWNWKIKCFDLLKYRT